MLFFKKHRTLWLSAAILVLLIVARMVYTQTLHFGFLFWNLFLAMLPLYFSHKASSISKRFPALVAAAFWLLFFPNSAYLFTDMIHLKKSSHLIYWLDMVVLYLAGMLGLMMSIRSLKEIEGWYGRFIHPRLKPLITFALMLLGGYGIYLGRVERWNSWDVVARPADLLQTMFYHSRHPFRNREVWMMTGIFGLGLSVLYYVFQGNNGPAVNSGPTERS